MIKNEVVEKLCYIPEDRLLDFPEDVLEAVAAYNMMVLDFDPDEAPEHTAEEIKERYAELKKRALAEGVEV